jgi:hypothetical protein
MAKFECDSKGGVREGSQHNWIDLAKAVFVVFRAASIQAQGADATFAVVFRKQLRRSKVLDFCQETGQFGCYGGLRARAPLGPRDRQI